MHQYISIYWIFIQCMHKAFQSSAEAVLQFWQVVSPYLPFHTSRSDSEYSQQWCEGEGFTEMLVLLHESIMIMWLIETLCVFSQNGDVCISILHPPVDDPQSGELPSERWNPTQNVRYGVRLVWLSALKFGPLCSLFWPFSTKKCFFFFNTLCAVQMNFPSGVYRLDLQQLLSQRVVMYFLH